MIYLERVCIGLSFLIAFMVYPFEMFVRYVITGKDCHKHTWAYKLVDKYS